MFANFRLHDAETTYKVHVYIRFSIISKKDFIAPWHPSPSQTADGFHTFLEQKKFTKIFLIC